MRMRAAMPWGSHAATAAAPASEAVPRARKLTRQLKWSARMPRGDAADEAAECGSADIEAHDEGDAFGRPLFTDVSDDDGDDAGYRDSLEKSPEDELRKRSGRCREQRGDGHAEDGEDDDALAGEPLSERAKDGRRNGDAQGGRGNRHADAGLRCVERCAPAAEERLRAIELEKGADAAERHCGGGQRLAQGGRAVPISEYKAASGYKASARRLGCEPLCRHLSAALPAV